MLGFGGAPLGKLLFERLDAGGETKPAEHFVKNTRPVFCNI